MFKAILIFFAVVLVIQRIRTGKWFKFTPGQLDYQDMHIVRKGDYSRSYSAVARKEGSNDLKAIGDLGEIQILTLLEALGGAVVFWSVGLKDGSNVAEIDVLAIGHYGVLHAEVKNYSGTFEPAPGQSPSAPFFWIKTKTGNGWTVEDPEQKKSPIAQADRARNMLRKAIRMGIGRNLPVHSAVFMVNDNLSLNGINDDRVPLYLQNEIPGALARFIKGEGIAFRRISDTDIADLVAHLLDAGLEPVFFDETLAPLPVQNEQEVAA